MTRNDKTPSHQGACQNNGVWVKRQKHPIKSPTDCQSHADRIRAAIERYAAKVNGGRL